MKFREKKTPLNVFEAYADWVKNRGYGTDTWPTAGYIFDPEDWRDRARDKVRRRNLRQQNAERPDAPTCAVCGGVVQGDDVTRKRRIILTADQSEFLGCCEPGDTLCFDCWFAIEPDIGERYNWGHA